MLENATTVRMMRRKLRGNRFISYFIQTIHFNFRTDLMTPCDATAKLTRKLKNWASKYDINCDESKSGKFLNKMHNQLDFVKSKIDKRMDC